MKNSTLTKLGSKTGFLSVFLSFAMLLIACNPTASDTTSSSANWSVKLSLSGGFAGLNRSISLNQDGQAIYIDKRAKSRVEKQVTQQDLQDYVKLVKILPVNQALKPKPTRCNDCINYVLVASFDGTSKRRTANDLTLGSSDANELIKNLTMLASEMATKK